MDWTLVLVSQIALLKSNSIFAQLFILEYKIFKLENEESTNEKKTVQKMYGAQKCVPHTFHENYKCQHGMAS